VLTAERQALGQVKRLARAALGATVHRFGSAAREQQELLAHVANLLIECYAIESTIARVEKMIGSDRSEAAIAADIARIYTSDAIDRAAHAGKQIVNALVGSLTRRDALITAAAQVRDHAGTDTVAARRRVGDAVIARSRYPF
jgi:lipopolysaccharide biosynthesis regulator YciM